MEKREKVILAVTVLAALYGAIDFLVLSKKSAVPDHKISPKRISAVAAQLATQTQGKDNTILQLVEQIKTPWPKKVFFAGSTNILLGQSEKIIKEKEVTAQFTPGMFVYSGYLEMGANKMAIINGSDYKKGDNINGFRLAEIDPTHINLVLEGVTFRVPLKPPINP